MSPRLTFDWQLPAGFVPFSPDDYSDEWLARFVAGHRGPGAAPDPTLEARIRKAVTHSRAQEDQPDGWAMVFVEAGGVPRMAGVADVVVTPWADPAEQVEKWHAELNRRGASPGECRLVGPPESTAALLRTVELMTDGARDAYVERGVIAKAWPRLGVTGVLRVTAATLLVFDDLMGFLERATPQFTVGPRHPHGPRRRQRHAHG